MCSSLVSWFATGLESYTDLWLFDLTFSGIFPLLSRCGSCLEYFLWFSGKQKLWLSVGSFVYFVMPLLVSYPHTVCSMFRKLPISSCCPKCVLFFRICLLWFVFPCLQVIVCILLSFMIVFWRKIDQVQAYCTVLDLELLILAFNLIFMCSFTDFYLFNDSFMITFDIQIWPGYPFWRRAFVYLFFPFSFPSCASYSNFLFIFRISFKKVYISFFDFFLKNWHTIYLSCSVACFYLYNSIYWRILHLGA